jgi:predicted DNA-binding antitoxin AbrB/MazE fold protein
MIQTITATYEDGVLKPTQPLDLPPNTQVRITKIELLPDPCLTVDGSAEMTGDTNVFLPFEKNGP